MSINSAYAVESPSVAVTLGGATFSLRHHDTSGVSYTKTMRALLKPYKRTLAHGANLPVEKEREISILAFVQCTLIGWQNLREHDDGPEIAYSEEAAVKLLTDYPRLYADLVAEASDFEQFRKSEVEATIKN